MTVGEEIGAVSRRSLLAAPALTVPTARSPAATVTAATTAAVTATTGVIPPGITPTGITPTGVGNLFVPLGHEFSETWESWPWHLCLISAGRIVMPAFMCGQSGTFAIRTSADLVAALRHDQWIGPITPHFVSICVGRYDLFDPAYRLDTYQANIRAAVSLLTARGILPIVCTVPPTRPGGLTSALDRGALLTMNMWLRNFAAVNALPLVDFHTLLADPATGHLAPGYASPTGYVWNKNAMKDSAELFWADARNLIRPQAPLITPCAGDLNTLCPNGMTLRDRGGGGVPDGFTVGDPVGLTVTAGDDQRFRGGRSVRLAVSRPGTHSPSLIFNVPSPTTRFAQGDVIALTFSYAVDSYTGTQKLEEMGFGVGVSIPMGMPWFEHHSQTGLDQNTPMAFTGLVRLPRPSDYPGFRLPPSSIDLSRVSFYWHFVELGDRAQTVAIGDIGVYNLTRLGVLENKIAMGTYNWRNVLPSNADVANPLQYAPPFV